MTTETKRKRGKLSTGSGLLFEIRSKIEGENGMMQQGEIAAFLDAHQTAVSRWERQGRVPPYREMRYTLLVLAHRIAPENRSIELQAWMDDTAAEFEARPLGSVFM